MEHLPAVIKPCIVEVLQFTVCPRHCLAEQVQGQSVLPSSGRCCPECPRESTKSPKVLIIDPSLPSTHFMIPDKPAGHRLPRQQLTFRLMSLPTPKFYHLKSDLPSSKAERMESSTPMFSFHSLTLYDCRELYPKPWSPDSSSQSVPCTSSHLLSR